MLLSDPGVARAVSGHFNMGVLSYTFYILTLVTRDIQ